MMFANPFLPFSAMLPPQPPVAKSYFTEVDRVVRAGQPSAKSVVRAQIQTGGFVTKRMKANMELPHQLAACRTPVDLAGVTFGYWLQAFEDYAQTAQQTAAMFGVVPADHVPTVEDWVPATANPRIDELRKAATAATEEAAALTVPTQPEPARAEDTARAA